MKLIANKEAINKFDEHIHFLIKKIPNDDAINRFDEHIHKLFWLLDKPSPEPHDYSKDYLTFVSLSNNNEIRFCNWVEDAPTELTIYVSTDNGSNWTSFVSSYIGVSEQPEGTLIGKLNTGDKLLVKGENVQYTDDVTYQCAFLVSGQCNVEGNTMSLIYGSAFEDKTEFPAGSSINFMYLFSGIAVVDASNLILPATTLTLNCYANMFEGCASLTIAPTILPATTLASYCYAYMFASCTSLTTAPELPAMTLADSCYYDMFQGCVSLTTTPKLPATTLAENCYYEMFHTCESLTIAPTLPATELASSCYAYMFGDCTNLTIVPKLPATTLADNCYESMFYNCINLTTAPELPATTLASYCYLNMFDGCESLNYIKCLAKDISATDCTSDWMWDVSSTGTFVKHPDMNDWGEGEDGIPENWDVEDAEI